MATRALRAHPVASLDQMLAAIPSLPRPVLSRLVSRMIDHLDELDGDADLEPEVDCCAAGDDGCGPVAMHGLVYWGAAQDARVAEPFPFPGNPVDESNPFGAAVLDSAIGTNCMIPQHLASSV